MLSGLIGYAQGVEGKLKEETTRYEQANAEYMLIEAEKFFLLEDYDRALAFLDKSLEVDKDNHAAHFKKAEIYLAQNQAEKGLESIKAAINIKKDNKYYYVLGAQLEKANRNNKGAADFYRLMIENTSDYSVYLVELAGTFQATGKLQDAIQVFEKAQNLTLDQSMKLVELYVQNSKVKQATELMQNLILQFPTDIDLKYQYANLLSTVGKNQEAITYLEAEPNKTAEMRLLLSNLYNGSGQSNAKYSLLIESFKDPEASLTDKTLLLGQLILDSGNDLPIRLIDSLQNNLENQYPNEALAIENGTYVYTKLAEISEGNERDLFQLKAMNRYKQLKDLKPGDFQVWDKVLSYEYNTGDWEALSTDADEALMLYPNQAIFYVYLASAKIQQKEADEAEDLLNQAYRMTRSNDLLKSQILGKQAEVAQLKGNVSDASNLYRQALTLPVIHPETERGYGIFQTNVSLENVATTKNDASQNTETDQKLLNIYTLAKDNYSAGHYNRSMELLKEYLLDPKSNLNGAILELYGDLCYQFNAPTNALKAWKRAKELGGTSDKIDQKIASGKIN